MSEQYYRMEDQLPDTPAQLIENFEAQSNSLANVVPEVAIALQQTGEALGELWNQAQEAGNTGAMALISASWQRTEMIANQTVQMDAVRQSAAAAIATIEEERKLVAERLEELETAIHYQDDTHPELKEFADNLRQEGAEEAQEMAEKYALEYAFDVSYDNISDQLKMITGCDWKQITRFIGILQGDYELTELQSAQLKAFIEELNFD